MEYIFDGIKQALRVIFTFDSEFINIIFISIKVSFTSTALAAIFGVPFGIFLAQKNFPGRNAVATILNTLMSLPTVVVGLMVYSFLSRTGPLGQLGLLYTLTAMVVGQFILIFPIISALTITAVKGLDRSIKPTALSLGADCFQAFLTFFHEARFAIAAAIIAGFARAFSEIGVSMMLGGNIKGYTRNITTAIALETSKGEFALGIALGIVLLTVALMINVVFMRFQKIYTNECL